MVEIENNFLDTTAHKDRIFTMSHFPRQSLKIVPTNDHYYLATDVIILYDDGSVFKKTLKLATNKRGNAYMEIPARDSQNFDQDTCLTAPANYIANLDGLTYTSNEIFGFNLEHYVNGKPSPEESVFKFLGLPREIDDMSVPDGTIRDLNKKQVGFIANYVKTHQKEIEDRVNKISEIINLAPTEEYEKVSSDFKEYFKAYIEGVGSFSDYNKASKKLALQRNARSESKPIKLNLAGIFFQWDDSNKTFGTFGG